MIFSLAGFPGEWRKSFFFCIRLLSTYKRLGFPAKNSGI